MALTAAADPPVNGLASIGEHVSGLYQLGSAEIFFGKVRESDLKASVPHQVFVLGADLQRDAFSQAKPSSWRYLIWDSGEEAPVGLPLATAEVDPDGEFLSLATGPSVIGCADVLCWAERLPSVQGGEYELRYLKVPGIAIVAVWLFDTSKRSAHILIPIAPTRALDADRQYTAQAFIVGCKRALEKRGKEQP